MTNYPIGDFLVRIKNAAIVSQREVVVAKTKMIKEVAQVLKKEGFLESVQEKEGKLLVKLAFQRKVPVLLDLKIVSKPGLRIYQGVQEILSRGKASILILSTSKGIVSSKQVKKLGIGGEVIAEIW